LRSLPSAQYRLSLAAVAAAPVAPVVVALVAPVLAPALAPVATSPSSFVFQFRREHLFTPFPSSRFYSPVEFAIVCDKADPPNE
jgi:hypothetical protein